jgi:anti-sigma factor RsiW
VSCTEPRALVDAYLDRELDVAKSLEIEEHVSECPVCSRAYEDGRRLRTALQADALYFRPPADLQRSIESLVRRETEQRARPRWFTARTIKYAAPLALAAAVALSIVPLLERASTGDLVVDEVVSGHVRSLLADHLTDVASSNKHTVKPWFDGKLDFAPVVVDLADQGFPLVGGRLDYLGNRSVAALVYGRQKHFINVFVWPSAGADDRGPTFSRHGFNVMHWKAGEMTYWAVSDLNAAELEEFAGLVRVRTTSAGP